MRSIGHGVTRTLACALSFLLGSVVFLPFAAGLLAQEPGTAPALEPERALTLVKGDRPAEAREPYRAVMDDDGRLYLTDVRKGDVLWFDANLVWKGTLAALHPQRTLGEPVRTAVDSRGRILVADAEGRQIYVFEDGAFTAAWGGPGDAPGQFRSLDDIALDADDMVWAADAQRGVLYTFTPDGLLERVTAGFTGAGFEKPTLLAVDPAGGVYVYDDARKQVFAGEADGTHRWTFDLARLGGKQLYDLAVGPAGNLFLVLKDKSRVAIVGPDGNLKGEIFGPSGDPRRFERLTGLSISVARSKMLVVDQKDLLVQALDLSWPAGTGFLEPAHRRFRAFSAGIIPGRVLAVSSGDEAVGADDRWLVQQGASLVVLDPAGETTGRVVLPGGVPEEPVATGTADGFLLVSNDRRLHRLGRDGSVVSPMPAATAGGELKRPSAIAWRSADGALAVYDRDDDEIQILSVDGAFLQRVGRKGTGQGEISKAVSLTFNSAGELLVVDLQGSRVQLFDSHGIYRESWAPVTINRSGGIALDVAADPWGRTFLLDEGTGTAAQLGPEGVQCQVGAPWRTNPVLGLAVTPGGDMLVSGGKDRLQTVRLRCVGPPPAPRGLRLTLDTGPEGGAVLAWLPGTPGAASFEVFRSDDGGQPERVATGSGASALIPRTAWGEDPGELSVRGLSDRGVPGTMSAPIPDRLTPALRGLTAGGDEVLAAELLLKEELAVAEAAGREDVISLRAAYLQSIIAQEDYDRARSELERFEGSLSPEETREMRLAIARAAVSGSIRAGAGEIAIQWLRPVGELAPETLSPVERLAVDLDAAGDTEVAAEMLVRHGYESSLDGVELTLALADVQVDADRPEQAMSTLVEASREASGPGLKRQLDRGIFELAASVTDGLLEGSILGRQDLTAEQQVDVLLRDLEAYSAEATGSSAEEWDLRLGALAAKTRIHRAVDLEGSDFQAAEELYGAILAETPFLLQPDEILVRGRLGALALAEGREDDARASFEQVLAISPDWVPAEDYFSPSVRSYVSGMREERTEQ